MKDYDLEILYHDGKANLVADALSRKGQVNAVMLVTSESKLLEEMRQMDLIVGISKELGSVLLSRVTMKGTTTPLLMTVILAAMEVRPDLHEMIKAAQLKDEKYKKHREDVDTKAETPFKIDEAGILRFGKRVYVPDDKEIKAMILSEAHESGYSLHPGEVKMYQDLKKYFWWPRMKKKVTMYRLDLS